MTNAPMFRITTCHDGGESEVHEWPGESAAAAVESFTSYLDACASIPHVPWHEVAPGIFTSPLPELHGEFALAVEAV